LIVDSSSVSAFHLTLFRYQWFRWNIDLCYTFFWIRLQWYVLVLWALFIFDILRIAGKSFVIIMTSKSSFKDCFGFRLDHDLSNMLQTSLNVLQFLISGWMPIPKNLICHFIFFHPKFTNFQNLAFDSLLWILTYFSETNPNAFHFIFSLILDYKILLANI